MKHDICPSRDDAQSHIYRHGECVLCGQHIIKSHAPNKYISIANNIRGIKMKSNALEILANLQSVNGYSNDGAARKAKLHKYGKLFLKELANKIGLPENTYDIRSNMGGVAVSGEVTLHADTIYMQLSESVVGAPGIGIMFRSCRGRKDYVGGRNQFASTISLSKYPEKQESLIKHLSALADGTYQTA